MKILQGGNVKSLHPEICLMGREAVILRIFLKCIYSESVNLFLLCMQIQVNHRQNLQSAQLVFWIWRGFWQLCTSGVARRWRIDEDPQFVKLVQDLVDLLFVEFDQLPNFNLESVFSVTVGVPTMYPWCDSRVQPVHGVSPVKRSCGFWVNHSDPKS